MVRFVVLFEPGVPEDELGPRIDDEQVSMKRRSLRVLAGLIVALGLGAWILVSQGPLPGDVWMTRGLQAVFGSHTDWANVLTKSATEPFMWALVATVGALAWALYGWRSGVSVALGFAVALTLDRLLRAFIYAPRPISDLIQVARPSDSSGFPSTFGLIYGATIGLLVILGWTRRDVTARLVTGAGVVLLVAGMFARVTVGGHWTSQVIASYAVVMAVSYSIAMLVSRTAR